MKRRRSAFLLEKLEPRLLFSADLALLPVDGGIQAADQDVLLVAPAQLSSDSVQTAETAEQIQREVIFIDAGVEDYQQLLDDIQAQAAEGRQFETVLLDSNRDGITQISDYLNSQQNISAVHIISHGSNGEVVLGDSPLNLSTLDTYAESIEGWQNALTDQADLLFYGCNLASGEEGQSLINSLSLLTGADVAASDDATGQAALGGDWELEYNIGQIESESVFGSKVQQTWAGILDSITVTTTSDILDGDADTSSLAALSVTPGSDGFISLREAIIAANSDAGEDEIILGTGTYTLSLPGTEENLAVTGDLDITDNLTITGVDLNSSIIDGNSIDRIFDVLGSSVVSVSGVTLQGGATINDGGALLVNNSAEVTISDSLLTGNSARAGGAIDNEGTLTLVDITIDNNTSTQGGGGISTTGVASLERVTVSNNTTSGNTGGGIEVGNGSFIATNVTISENSAEANGGGIFTIRPITLINTTITNNTATAGSGVHAQGGGSADLTNTIIAANNSHDVTGDFTSSGNNLIGDGDSSGLTDGVNGDQIGSGGSPIDPLLGSLQDNGGSTLTHALLVGSSAIDAGTTTGAPATDQRGITRDAMPDIGAFEAVPTVSLTVAKDTYVDIDEPNTNYGTSTSLVIDRSGGDLGDQHPLLQFDLSSLPVGVTITKATLRMEATANAEAFDINIYELIEAWSDDIADWDDRDRVLLFDVPWSTPGGTIDPTVVATLNTDTIGSHSWDLTSLVQAWYDGSKDNNGIMIASPNTGTTSVTYDSSEGTTPPVLEIYYAESNSAPTNISPNSFLIDENIDTTGGTSVGTLTTTDPDVGETFTYSILPGGDATNFSIGGASNDELIFDDGILDFETKASYAVTVRVTDSASNTYDETLTVGINDINDAPTAVADNFTVNEGSTTSLDLASNDSDPDDGLDLTSISIVSGPSNGTIDSINADGTVDYTHNGSETISDSFTYSIDDLAGATSNTVTVSLTITPVNDAPTATNMGVTVLYVEDTPLDLTDITISDVDSPNVTATLTLSDNSVGTFSTATSGSVTSIFDSGTGVWTASGAIADVNMLLSGVLFTPTLNYDGQFSIDTSVDDGVAAPITGTITVNSTAVNDAPTITSTANVAATEDNLYSYTFTVNDVDAGDTLTLSAPILPAWLTFDAGTGVLSGTPTNGEVGDHAVILRVNDGTVDVDQDFTITVTNVNDAPTVANPIPDQTADEDSPFTFQFAANTFDDVDGDTLTYSSDISFYGWLSFDAATRTFSGTPLNADIGTITVTVIADDGNAGTVSDSFDIVISNTNDAPTAINLDNLDVDEFSAGAIVGNLSTTDVDAGDTHTYTVDDVRFEIVAGQLKLQAGQSLDHETEASVNVTVTSTDSGGLSTTQLFTMTVNDLNDTPVAVNDNLSAVEDNALTIISLTDLLVNDSDPDGDSLSMAAFTQPTHGALVDHGDGTLTYTPNHNFSNTDSFDYTISDGNGGTASGTAFIYVAPVGDTPQVADAVVLAGSQSNPIIISRHASDGAEVTHFRISGVNGGSLFLANGVTQVNNGDYISVAQGQAGLRFTPADVAAEGNFQVESSEDGLSVAAQSGRATSTIRVTVLPPTSTPESEVTPEIEESIDEPIEEEITEEEVDEVVEETTEAVETPVETQLPIKEDSAANSNSGQSGSRNSLINPILSFIQNVASANDNDSSLNTGQLSTLQTLNVILETTPIETLRNVWDSLDIGTLSVRDYNLVRSSFDALQQEVQQENRIETAVVSSAIATTMGLSAGYVVWMLKGGSLLASLLSSMPAWHLADPLSILAGGSKGDEDDESLESIIKEGEKKEAKKKEEEDD